MEPNFQFEGLDLANRFAMDSLNMAYTDEFIYNDKSVPKGLFLDIMIEKDTDVSHSSETYSTWTCSCSKS